MSLFNSPGGYPVLATETGVVNTVYPYGDVRRYGAIGDGVTNDTVAVRHAFASLAAAEGAS